MQVQLKTAYQLEVHGTAKHLKPGDWVEVGKQEALRLLANNQAHIPTFERKKMIPDGSGIAIPTTGGNPPANVLDVPVQMVDPWPQLPFDKNVVWQQTVGMPEHLMLSGLYTLESWEIAVPLMDYDILANHSQFADEHEYTKGLIRDLRVPNYNPVLFFARNTDSIRTLLAIWNEQRAYGEGLAFLRALYLVKPLVLALPYTWGVKGNKDKYTP